MPGGVFTVPEATETVEVAILVVPDAIEAVELAIDVDPDEPNAPKKAPIAENIPPRAGRILANIAISHPVREIEIMSNRANPTEPLKSLGVFMIYSSYSWAFSSYVSKLQFVTIKIFACYLNFGKQIEIACKKSESWGFMKRNLQKFAYFCVNVSLEV